MNIFNKPGIALIFACFAIVAGWDNVYSASQKKSTVDKNTVLELSWDDLVPEEFSVEEVFKQNGLTMEEVAKLNDDAELAKKIMSDIKAAYESVGIVESLDGRKVSLTGFAVPLEFIEGGKIVTEFLLVPYKGACIHLPPPPPQKIIYVKSTHGIGTRNISRALVVKGVLKAESAESRYATASYILESSYINRAGN